VTCAHAALLAESRRLERSSVDATLSLGAAIRVHQVMLELIPERLRSVADEEVIAELRAEERSLGENLDYLKSLYAAEPDSPDVDALAAALLERIRQHLDRSDRVLFRPLQSLYRAQK
jgi:hemerythrin-like domain-containing protein